MEKILKYDELMCQTNKYELYKSNDDIENKGPEDNVINLADDNVGVMNKMDIGSDNEDLIDDYKDDIENEIKLDEAEENLFSMESVDLETDDYNEDDNENEIADKDE